MAIVRAGNTAIDTTDPAIGTLSDGDPVTATTTYASLRTGLFLDEFYGSFQYDVFGDLAGGTLTGWKETYSGQLVFEITGASVSVQQFLGWVAADANLLASQTILAGDDQIFGSGFGDRLVSFAGNDSVTGAGGDDTITSGGGNDTVSAGLGNDVIREDSGTNYLRGDEGDDSIVGGNGFDDINGNMGNDTCVSGGGDDWVVGGRDNDSLSGSDGQNLVYGNLGSDTCDGGAGNDIVRGGQDNDLIRGGAGNDYVSGDKGDDTVSGGTGADEFHSFGDAGIDRIIDFSLAEGDRVRLDPGTTYTVAQSGADTVISMDGGGQAILVGVSMSSLTGNWIFVG
jgi:Ca2+-binding RTX toxin-like protein